MGSRIFLSLFGLDPGQDIRKTAVAAVRDGYAVVPVAVGGKAPVCTLTTRELQATGTDHDCGVHHAITDPEVANKVFTRLTKGGARINIGVVAGPSRLLVVDADTADEVQAFVSDWAEAEGDPGYLTHTPTVRSPGLMGDEGLWRHKDGGHFYFAVPDGVDLPWDVRGSMKADGGYDVRWGMSQTLVPPSVRPEGPYRATGDIVDAPGWLIARVQGYIADAVARRVERAALTAHDGVAAWSVATSWEELLTRHGWGATGKVDRCGCEIWTKPGGGSTSYKSATAHDPDCLKYDNVEGHGPLHLWTTDPPKELLDFVQAGQQTITKLMFVAAMEYGGDITEAMAGVGIDAVDLGAWGLPRLNRDDVTARDGDPVTTVTRSTSDGRTEDQAEGVPAGHTLAVDRDDENGDGVTTPCTSTTVTSSRRDITPDIVAAMEARGIPSAHIEDVAQRVAKGLLQDAANEVVAKSRARATAGPASSWMAGPDFVERFLSGAEEAGPSVLQRVDGRCLFMPGRVNGVVGRRAAGKTWLALVATRQVLESGGRVLYYDMEDTEASWGTRLRHMGCDIDTHVREGRAVWVKPDNIPVDNIDEVTAYAGTFDLIVFDVMNRLIVRLGGNPDSGNAEVMWLYDNLFDPIVAGGATVVVLDHPNRRGQRRDATSVDELAPGGGAMKMNNASGVVLGMQVTNPFSRENPEGQSRLICLKDRSGHFEEGEAVGDLRGRIGLDARDGVGLDLQVHVPAPDQTEEEGIQSDLSATTRFLVTRLRGHGHAESLASLRRATTARLRGFVEIALEELVADPESHVATVDEGKKYVWRDDVTDE